MNTKTIKVTPTELHDIINGLSRLARNAKTAGRNKEYTRLHKIRGKMEAIKYGGMEK